MKRSKWSSDGNMLVMALILIVVTASSSPCGTGESGLPSLMRDSYGGRVMALGDTFVGIADDANAISVNPAGLATIGSLEASIMHLRFPLDMNFTHVALAVPLFSETSGGALGITVTYFNSPGFQQIDSAGNEVDGDLSASDLMAGIGYANDPLRKLGLGGFLGVGIGVKYFRSTLAGRNGSGLCADFGLLFRIAAPGGGGGLPDRNLGVGLSAQNLGGNFTYDVAESPLPSNIRAGIGYHVFRNKYSGVLVGVDVNGPNDSPMIVSTGLEISLLNVLILRGGFKPLGREAESFSAGIGMQYEIAGRKLGLDYAYVPLEDLGTMTAISIGVRF